MQRITEAMIAVGVLAMMTSLGGCGRAKDAVQQAQKARDAVKAGEELRQEGRTRIQTEEGEVEIAEGAAVSDLEIRVYPGAEQQDATEISTPTVEGIKAQYTSTDAFEDVASFYRSEFPDAEMGEFSEGDGQRFMLSAEEEGREFGVVVRSEADEDTVQIELVQRVTKAKE